VTVALTAGGAAVALANVWLLAACWKRRSVLAGLLGAVGIPLAAFAIATGSGRRGGDYALAGSAIALLIGGALFGIGQAVERLLDDEPDDPVR
jgi:hypothetical protein